MTTVCAICGAELTRAGAVRGKYAKREFTLMRCECCGFACVADPWLDYAAIYDERYYNGKGADHLANYIGELLEPEKTIRMYEWAGITRLVEHLVPGRPLRWLDFGCGTGGLVRYVRSRRGHEIVGFEPSPFAAKLGAHGVPLVRDDELDDLTSTFDVVTAVEVIEHTVDPLAELRRIRSLLKPGGLLFLTTGNAEPYAHRLPNWRYVIPEIHLSYFEPRTLERAFTVVGLSPQRVGMAPGFDDIIKFKVLKNLHMKRRNRLTDLLPKRLIAGAGESVARVTEQPIGWAAN